MLSSVIQYVVLFEWVHFLQVIDKVQEETSKSRSGMEWLTTLWQHHFYMFVLFINSAVYEFKLRHYQCNL
jgi:hypothetical protein